MTESSLPPRASPIFQRLAAIARFLSTTQLSYALVIVALVIVGVAATVAMLSVNSLRDSELKAIRNRLEIPAQAMAHGIWQIANNADLMVQSVRTEIKNERPLGDQGAELTRLLVERVYARSAFQKIEIYDLAAKRIASSVGDSSAFSAAALDFFKRQAAAVGDQLLVSDLIRDSSDDRAKIVLSRPIIGGNGAVRGVIADYIDAEYIQRLFDSLPMPAGSAIVLFSKSGRHLLRSPALAQADKARNLDFSQHAPFLAFRNSGPAGAFREFKSLVSGSDRFVAGVGEPDSPFVVTAAWDAASALAHWRRVAAAISAVTVAGIAIVIALFAYIVLALRLNEVLLDKVSRSEGKARALVAALPDAVMIIDQSLMIVFANRAAENLFGYASGELDGLAMQRTMSPKTRSIHEQNLSSVFASLKPRSGIQGLERTATRKDGSEFPIEISASPYESPEGRLLVAVIRDVGGRQAKDRALRRSRENLSRAQRVAGVGSFERDLVTGEVEFSDQLYRIHGIALDGKKPTIEFLHTLVHPDDRERVAEFRRAADSGTPPAAIDYRIVRPDGIERVLHRECDIVYDERGKPVCLVGTLQDITDRKKIELKLHQSRENLTRAQHLAGIGSFERDLITGERDLSDEFKRIWGIDDVQSGRVQDFLAPLIHPDDRQRFHEMREAAFRGEPAPSADFKITRPDGEERIVHPEFRVIFDENGTPLRMFGTVQDITERKKIEIELRRSREKLARAHRIAGIGSFERDLVSGELEWSDEFMRIWGITNKPVRGSAELLLSLVHPEDRQRFMEGRDAALQRKSNPPLDFRVIRPDGEERIVHREYGVQFDDKGKAVRMFGTVQDITERKRIENELRRSRENLARAQRIAGMGSFDRDIVADKAEWSDEMYRIMGIEKGAGNAGYEAFIGLVHPEDRGRIGGAIVAELKGVRAGALEFRLVRPDGKERIVRRESDVVFGEEGRPIRVYGTVQDITEHKKAELELLHSRENLARAQRFAGMGSFERDLVTAAGEWSEEMYRILGVEKHGGVPDYIALMNLIHPDDRKMFRAYRAAEIKGRPAHPLEYRIVRPDGVERIVRRESAVVFDDEKRPIRVHGTLQDITEQRLAERRERELERQLLHSQKLEALGTLAGGIAHDLNNTLVPIMALSKLTARRFEAGSLVRANLETIYEASERARDLVKRVVAFSRKDEPEKRDTDIAEIVDEALKLLRATIPSSITLEARITKVPPIPADPSQIHQVVTNLVSNASQAIGGDIGAIVVALELRSRASGCGEICLSVSDTGMGMDETTQQRIFEPFFTTKPVGQGTGLGLSIVHGIVAGHNGRIEVTSTPGKGTRFDLYFPVPAGEAAVKSSRPAA